MSALVRSLDVSLASQPVGRLELHRSGLARWVPLDEWEERGQRPRLGIAFLRRPGPRSEGTGLPAWFENLLPEAGSALRQRLATAHGVREGQAFGLLQAIGRDVAGAVEITPSLASAPPADAPGEGASAGDEDAAEGLANRLRFSLAGMQPKLSMSMANERLVLRAEGPSGQWIVKLPSRELPELPEESSARR